MGFYVDIANVKPELLEFLGYYLIEENERFSVYVNKDDDYIVQKTSDGKRYLHVDDLNDAHALGYRSRVVAPVD